MKVGIPIDCISSWIILPLPDFLSLSSDFGTYKLSSTTINVPSLITFFAANISFKWCAEAFQSSNQLYILNESKYNKSTLPSKVAKYSTESASTISA